MTTDRMDEFEHRLKSALVQEYAESHLSELFVDVSRWREAVTEAEVKQLLPFCTTLGLINDDVESGILIVDNLAGLEMAALAMNRTLSIHAQNPEIHWAMLWLD